MENNWERNRERGGGREGREKQTSWWGTWSIWIHLCLMLNHIWTVQLCDPTNPIFAWTTLTCFAALASKSLDQCIQSSQCSPNGHLGRTGCAWSWALPNLLACFWVCLCWMQCHAFHQDIWTTAVFLCHMSHLQPSFQSGCPTLSCSQAASLGSTPWDLLCREECPHAIVKILSSSSLKGVCLAWSMSLHSSNGSHTAEAPRELVHAT